MTLSLAEIECGRRCEQRRNNRDQDRQKILRPVELFLRSQDRKAGDSKDAEYKRDRDGHQNDLAGGVRLGVVLHVEGPFRASGIGQPNMPAGNSQGKGLHSWGNQRKVQSIFSLGVPRKQKPRRPPARDQVGGMSPILGAVSGAYATWRVPQLRL